LLISLISHKTFNIISLTLNLINVASASKNAPEILKRTGLYNEFDAISCGLDITKSKPDPEVFLVAANKLGVKYEDCLDIRY